MIYIVYWTGTGNTEIMANQIAEGVRQEKEEAKVVIVSEITPQELKQEDVFALGCPSMGAEELEETEMEPFISELEKYVEGKRIALFGSYGWGDGEWMFNWEERLKKAGATIIEEHGIIVMGEPDNETNEKLKELGKKMTEKVK